MRLRALADLEYQNENYDAGDVFYAEERDATMLLKQGLAEPADEDEGDDERD